MRILIISAEFPPQIGGIGAVSYNMAKGLQQEGHEVKVLTAVGVKGNSRALGLDVARTPSFLNRKGIKLVPLFLAALWLCLVNRPHWLLLSVWTHEGIIGYVLHKLLRTKYVVVAHGSEILLHRDNSVLRPLMARVFRGGERVITNSRYTKGLVVSLGIEPERVSVVHPTLDLQEYDQQIELGDVEEMYGLENKRVLLTVGRLTPRKGHDQVIGTLSSLSEQYPDLVYVFTGSGEWGDALRALAKGHGVEHMVRMVGPVSFTEMQKLYKMCQVFVMVSRQEGLDVEGFGISFLEANLFGKPVLGGSSGGVPDAVLDGVTGLLADPYDTEDIKAKLVLLLEDEALRRRLGEQGRERVIRDFTLPTLRERLKEIFT
jgi:phosphatidylinositol alpha-1,6-mannosyltransferase